MYGPADVDEDPPPRDAAAGGGRLRPGEEVGRDGRTGSTRTNSGGINVLIAWLKMTQQAAQCSNEAKYSKLKNLQIYN